MTLTFSPDVNEQYLRYQFTERRLTDAVRHNRSFSATPMRATREN